MGQHDSKSLELLKITQNEFALQNFTRMAQYTQNGSRGLKRLSKFTQNYPKGIQTFQHGSRLLIMDPYDST